MPDLFSRDTVFRKLIYERAAHHKSKKLVHLVCQTGVRSGRPCLSPENREYLHRHEQWPAAISELYGRRSLNARRRPIYLARQMQGNNADGIIRARDLLACLARDYAFDGGSCNAFHKRPPPSSLS